jgi:hypothetical protein
MKLLTLSLTAYGAAIALSLSPTSHARAQDAIPPDTAPMAGASATHGDWTLRQREDWLSDRLDKSRADGSLDHSEYDRARQELNDLRHEESHMRDGAHGQLTDNETADLEARLDAMAAKIHWANMATYTRPW